jgi:hypothetical protein
MGIHSEQINDSLEFVANCQCKKVFFLVKCRFLYIMCCSTEAIVSKLIILINSFWLSRSAGMII